MAWKRPPKVTAAELSKEPPFIRRTERRETRRDRAAAAGVFALIAVISVFVGSAGIAGLAAGIAGYLINDSISWDYKYKTEVSP